MESTQIEGEMLDDEDPRWEPLEAALGEVLAARFMWMFRIRLSDGREVEAYKHKDTRRYLYLTSDGESFGWAGRGLYVPVPLSKMMGLVFRGWHRLRATPIELVTVKAVAMQVRKRERKARREVITAARAAATANPG